MKRLRKILAMVVSLAMVLGMSLTAFAAVPTGGETREAKIHNVEANAKVMAYQIVNAYCNENGFVEYRRANGITEDILANKEIPTAGEITAIASNKTLLDSLVKAEFKAGAPDADGLATFTANLTPGYWVAVVTGSERQVIYNPMLIGVYYSVGGSDSTLSGGDLDADSNWGEGTDWTVEADDVYAKSTEPTLDKKITGSTTQSGSSNTDSTLSSADYNGNDVAIGDFVDFEIDTQIPAYSDSYTDVIVTITDQLSAGLSLNGAPVVTVNGQTATSGTDYTYEEGKPENGYTISFNSAYALQHSGEAVVVTYSAQLLPNAATNFDPNTNTASLIYTNDPQNKNNTNTIEDKTYTYTFEIDGNLYGSSKETENWNKVTEELLKGHKISENVESGTTERDNFAPLSGAEFKLTNNVTGKEYIATSDEKGMLNFKGLDAGTYTLIETKAPEGYTINSDRIPVEITAEYNNDGTLKSYTIKVANQNTSTYTATYEKSEIKNVTTNYIKEGDDHVSDSYFFWNTKLSELPSTGGIGTTIFTIGGCIIMIIAAGLFFASRRKSSAK